MRRVLYCCLAASIGAAGLDATILNELSHRDLVAQADTIVVGKCTGSDSRWEDGNLFTYTKIAVAEVLKGEPGAGVTVVLPGGVDLTGPVPIGQDYEGGPVIAPGEEVFLFLRRIEGIPNGFAVVGFSQGKFTIRTDASGRQVFRDLTGVAYPAERGVRKASSFSAPFQQFKAEVQSLLRPATSPPAATAARKP